MRRAASLMAFPLLAAVVVLSGCTTDSDVEDDRATPLTVLSTSPADGDDWVPSEPLRVRFSKPVTLTSVRDGLRIVGMTVDVQYDAATRTAFVKPEKPLVPGRPYTLTILRIVAEDGSTLSDVITINFKAS